MKRRALLLFLLLSGFPAFGQQAGLTLHPAQIELGTVGLKSKTRVEVKAYNQSDKPLVIREIQTDCVCTKPKWDKSPLMPGDSTVISVQFAPNDMGAFYKKLRVVTVPRQEQATELILRGKVE